MSNPKDNFNGFFNDPAKAASKFKPTPDKVIEALMIITSENTDWYKDSNLRIVVLGTMSKLAEDLKKLSQEDMKAQLPVHAAAFLMLLGDFAAATKDQYASPMEIENFHTPVDEEDEDA